MTSQEGRVTARLLATLIVCVASVPAAGQGRGGGQTPPTDTVAPAIPGVVAAGTPVRVIKDGFNGSEGPIALADGSVIFSETNASRTIRIDPAGTVSVFLENTGGANGMSFDTDGRLFATHVPFGATKVSIIYPKGKESLVVDNYQGKPFGRANDLTVARNGAIYFTDSANPTPAPAAPLPLPPALYYVTPGSRIAVQVLSDLAFPNGVVLSRDEKTLYLNNTNGGFLVAFDVKPDGSLTNRRNFAEYKGVTKNANGAMVSGADGITIDNDGRLHVASTIGVQVFSPAGQHLGTIELSRAPQNLAFAGKDKRTLYVVGRGVAFQIQMLAQGFTGRAK
jgi:gluconolactonase